MQQQAAGKTRRPVLCVPEHETRRGTVALAAGGGAFAGGVQELLEGEGGGEGARY